MRAALVIYTATTAITVIITRALIGRAREIGIIDIPNERSSHKSPTPRTGGIALLAGVMFGLTILTAAGRGPGAWIFAGAVYFFGLGLLEDRRSTPPSRRLALQAIFCLAMAVWGPRIQSIDIPGNPWQMPPLIAVAVTTFWHVGFINLFNFMDGIDGIAAGQAAIAGIFISLASGMPSPFVVSAAAVGFLFYNHQPAKIFMGDSGSYLLGFLLAALCVSAGAGTPFPAYILILGTFIADTTITLVRRKLNGEPCLQAHRSHYYQKLTDIGFSHAQVSAQNLALSGLLGLSGLLYIRSTPPVQALLLACWAAVCAVGVRTIHRRWDNLPRKETAP